MKKKKHIDSLSINQILRKLQLIKKKHGNVPVYFDTEAGKFAFHYANISGVWFMKEEWSGTGKAHVYLTTHDPIQHDRTWAIENIKLNFAMMVNRVYFKNLSNLKTLKSRWQLEFLDLPQISNKNLPLTHESDKAFFKKYWKLDNTTYEKFMKSYFPGWLKCK
jgi:hypothetical protein